MIHIMMNQKKSDVTGDEEEDTITEEQKIVLGFNKNALNLIKNFNKKKY